MRKNETGFKRTIKKCEFCGKKYAAKSRQRFCCKKCNSKYYKARQRKTSLVPKQIEDREVTDDTEFFMCIDIKKQKSLEYIAEAYNRNITQVDKIIRDAILSGRYLEHVLKYETYQEEVKETRARKM